MHWPQDNIRYVDLSSAHTHKSLFLYNYTKLPINFHKSIYVVWEYVTLVYFTEQNRHYHPHNTDGLVEDSIIYWAGIPVT